MGIPGTLTNDPLHQPQIEYQPDDDPPIQPVSVDAGDQPVRVEPEHTVIRPQIKRRGRSRHVIVMAGGRYRKSDGPPIGRRELIDDVYPTLPMKVYGLEKDVNRLQDDLKRHVDESIAAGKHNAQQFATREGLADLDKSVNTELRDLKQRFDKRTGLVVIQTIGLLVSMAYALILSYKHFIQP